MQDAERRAWVERHRVTWEIDPLVEVVKGHGVQRTGYELRLFGRLEFGPDESDAERERRAHEVFEGLREVVEHAIGPEPRPLMDLDVVSYDHSAHLRPESGFQVEIELTVRATPRHPDRPLSPAERAEQIQSFERHLAAQGARSKTWGGQD